jgi:hypothetical protein
MIYIRTEKEDIKDGFNFYRLSDKGSFGFVFKMGTQLYWFRYSKRLKEFFVSKSETKTI